LGSDDDEGNGSIGSMACVTFGNWIELNDELAKFSGGRIVEFWAENSNKNKNANKNGSFKIFDLKSIYHFGH
jgi:hypothetical protein